MTPEQLKALIEKGIANATAIVEGDGSHFYAYVISDAFAGLSPVKRHQLVYAVLGNGFDNAIHALSLQTLTCAEWEVQAPQLAG
ncbi:MAG: BolA/IbaG family iron-sulfur metabolism protein [Gammaproteobacteria bacterium]|nr:BolA/IbaG family iron-sulfur metabolism protein [Gammaproteobacteria bacterium]